MLTKTLISPPLLNFLRRALIPHLAQNITSSTRVGLIYELHQFSPRDFAPPHTLEIRRRARDVVPLDMNSCLNDRPQAISSPSMLENFRSVFSLGNRESSSTRSCTIDAKPALYSCGGIRSVFHHFPRKDPSQVNKIPSHTSLDGRRGHSTLSSLRKSRSNARTMPRVLNLQSTGHKCLVSDMADVALVVTETDPTVLNLDSTGFSNLVALTELRASLAHEGLNDDRTGESLNVLSESCVSTPGGPGFEKELGIFSTTKLQEVQTGFSTFSGVLHSQVWRIRRPTERTYCLKYERTVSTPCHSVQSRVQRVRTRA